MPTKTETPETQEARIKTAKINITVKLDKDLVRRARVLAAEQGTSVSALLSAKLEEELDRRAAYEQAKKDALAVMAGGWDLGGHVPTREEMHER